jgi:hypothetical protein
MVEQVLFQRTGGVRFLPVMKKWSGSRHGRANALIEKLDPANRAVYVHHEVRQASNAKKYSLCKDHPRRRQVPKPGSRYQNRALKKQ